MIDAVYMLGIDKRKHMWGSIQDQVKYFLTKELRIFVAGNGQDKDLTYDHIDLPASRELYSKSTYGNDITRKNHANAFICHQKIFKEALDLGYDNILHLEDDCYFIENRWNTIFPSTLVQDFIDNGDYDALYLGWQQREYPADTDELTRVEYAWEDSRTYNIERARPIFIPISGLHAVLLKRSMIERLAKLEQGPVDSFLNRNLERFKLYYIAPKIIGALECYSQAECRHQKRPKLT